MASLNVPREVQVGKVEQLRCTLNPLIALPLLFADRKESDTRIRHAEHTL